MFLKRFPSGVSNNVYAEAERLEKRFRTGIDESENTKFETYAEHWLDRAAKRYKASTLAGYRKMLEVAYPYIGALPLCKVQPMVLEEFAEELRKRPGRGGKPLSENTVTSLFQAPKERLHIQHSFAIPIIVHRRESTIQ